MRKYLLLLWLILAAVPDCPGQAALSVTPAYAVITRDAPHGTFSLSNNGSEGVEVVIYAKYGVIATRDSTTEVLIGEGGQIEDLSPQLIFFPDRLILMPGDERVVRYMVDDVDQAAQGAHITLMHFEMQERAAASLEQVPVVASALSIVYNLVTPLVFINGTSQPVLKADVARAARGLLVVDLETENGWPFLGGIAVMRDDVTLGRTESAIYTRRRVENPDSERSTSC